MPQFNKMFMTQLLAPLKYCKKRNIACSFKRILTLIPHQNLKIAKTVKFANRILDNPYANILIHTQKFNTEVRLLTMKFFFTVMVFIYIIKQNNKSNHKIKVVLDHISIV